MYLLIGKGQSAQERPYWGYTLQGCLCSRRMHNPNECRLNMANYFIQHVKKATCIILFLCNSLIIGTAGPTNILLPKMQRLLQCSSWSRIFTQNSTQHSNKYIEEYICYEMTTFPFDILAVMCYYLVDKLFIILQLVTFHYYFGEIRSDRSLIMRSHNGTVLRGKASIGQFGKRMCGALYNHCSSEINERPSLLNL